MADGTAIVFPGMGPSSFADVARFMVVNSFARRLVGVADDVLGYSLVDRYRDTPGDYSEPAQVAFLVNCLALADWAADTIGMAAQVCAGPSFGGKAAAVFSGALDVAAAVGMTSAWARLLEDYFAAEHRDAVTLSFTRTPPEVLADIRAELDARGEWHELSCQVDRDFVMMTLRESVVDWLRDRLRSVGGWPLYTMRPPMHCAAFTRLRERAEAEVFAGVRFADPRVPVVSDQDGSVRTTGDGVRAMLLDGFTEAVRWPDVVAALSARGVTTVYVSGPDSLFGRVRVTTGAFSVVRLNPQLAMRPRVRQALA